MVSPRCPRKYIPDTILAKVTFTILNTQDTPALTFCSSVWSKEQVLSIFLPFSRHNDVVKHIQIIGGPSAGGYGFATNYTNHRTLTDLVHCYHKTSLQVHNPELDTTLMFPVGDAANN